MIKREKRSVGTPVSGMYEREREREIEREREREGERAKGGG